MYHTFRRPTILVLGATGAQGGGVARHLLADGRWTVRAFTRDPQSSAARTLRDAGAEIAVGDLGDPASLRRAMVLCHGVHGITSQRAACGVRVHALRQARAIVDAAAATGVKHLVLQSSGADAPVDAQREWARRRGVPTTLVRAAFHYESLLDAVAAAPSPLAAVSAEDVGGVVAAIFARGDEHAGRTIGVVGDVRPAHAYAETLARALAPALRWRVRHGAAPCPPRAPYAARPGDLEESRRLFPRLRTFEQWVGVHARELARGVAAPEVEALAPATIASATIAA